MAPESSRIRTCHISVLSSGGKALKTSSAGHFHCGKFKMARVGTKNDIVPPCTSGSLQSQQVSTIRLFAQRLFLVTN